MKPQDREIQGVDEILLMNLDLADFLLRRKYQVFQNILKMILLFHVLNLQRKEKALALIAKEYLKNYILNGIVKSVINNGEGKTVCMDHSSRISKQIHMGHLCTTVIGECLAKVYQNAGYKVVRINYRI